MPASALDLIDHRILDALQSDGRLTNVALAERVNLSPSPCLRRLKRLEREGYISTYRAILDRRKVGLDLTVFIGVKVSAQGSSNPAKFQAAVLEMPEVVSCHVVSGEADFLLEVVVPDLEHYEHILIGTILGLPGVTEVKSNFAIRTVKTPSPLPLNHLP